MDITDTIRELKAAREIFDRECHQTDCRFDQPRDIAEVLPYFPQLKAALILTRNMTEADCERLTGRRAFSTIYRSAELTASLQESPLEMHFSSHDLEQCYRVLDAAVKSLGGDIMESGRTQTRVQTGFRPY